jgi:hypothetical protein
MMRALAAAFSAPPRLRTSNSAAIQRETLIPALAASTRTQARVATSMLMVTFFMTRRSCFTNFVSMAPPRIRTAVCRADRLFRQGPGA